MTYTHKEWEAKGEELFGDDRMKWRFVCPSCKHIASTQDWKDAGAKSSAVAFSCVGRWLPTTQTKAFSRNPGPCNYAGGGLICINPVEVDFGDQKERYFDFDRLPVEQPAQPNTPPAS